MSVFVLDSSVLFDLVHGGIDREVLGHYSMETPLLMVSEVIEHHERLISSGLTFVPLSGEEEKLADAMLGSMARALAHHVDNKKSACRA